MRLSQSIFSFIGNVPGEQLEPHSPFKTQLGSWVTFSVPEGTNDQLED
jgi:hypothetical protein